MKRTSGWQISRADAQFRRLYIVDDDELDRRRSCSLLKCSQHHIRDFDSGKAFLDHDPDLENACVILDVCMPEVDGLSVIGHILKLDPKCPIIMLSGHSTLHIAVEAMKRGAIDFLEKPVSQEAILKAVERAFYQRAAENDDAPQREELLRRVTRREGQVLQLLVQGHPNKIVAYQLGIAENTVEVHRRKLMKRLNLRTFADLVRIAVKAGI